MIEKCKLVASAEQIPFLMSAKDIQNLGFSRQLAYQMLNRADMPVTRIGKRIFVQKSRFLEWLDMHSSQPDT